MTNTFNENFKRIEKKYLLTSSQYETFMERIKPYIKDDMYAKSTICNVYYDTSDFQLIRNSLDKPVYKEKLRLRSYGVPKAEDMAFIEIKKKYNGIVYKRRISLPYKEAVDYLHYGVRPVSQVNDQILKEIDFFIKMYRPEPKMFIAYERHAYVGVFDPTLRMTFDSNLRNRNEKVGLNHGSKGETYFEDDRKLLEIKIAGAYPEWLVNALNQNAIYPVSFSKYGSFYKKKIAELKASGNLLKEFSNDNSKKVTDFVGREESICLLA